MIHKNYTDNKNGGIFMSGEIAFANTALESFAALVTFVLLFACIAKIKMQR